MNRFAMTSFLLTAILLSWSAASEEKLNRGEGDLRPAFEKRWFIGTGSTNVHPRLEESEHRINTQLNDRMRMIPGWTAPETFADWRDDLKLWDLWVQVGRDINEQWSWFVVSGGISGAVRNEKIRFALVTPIKVDMDWHRTEAFVTAGLSYYPRGKPMLSDTEKSWPIYKRAVLGAKPFFEASVGYVFVREVGDVKIHVPVLGQVMHEHQSLNFHMIQVSPRVGIEMPLTENNSYTINVAYAFVDKYADEFNGPSISFMFKHKF